MLDRSRAGRRRAATCAWITPRSRRPTGDPRSIRSRSARVSDGGQCTGVALFFTTCFGPRRTGVGRAARSTGGLGVRSSVSASTRSTAASPTPAPAAGREGRRTSHDSRVGLAVELSERGATTHAIQLAGGWKDPARVIRYAASVNSHLPVPASSARLARRAPARPGRRSAACSAGESPQSRRGRTSTTAGWTTSTVPWKLGSDRGPRSRFRYRHRTASSANSSLSTAPDVQRARQRGQTRSPYSPWSLVTSIRKVPAHPGFEQRNSTASMSSTLAR